MFKRILTSAALVLGLAVPAATGIALLAPEVAHASGPYYCGGVSQPALANEDQGYWILDYKQPSPNNDVMAYDGYEGGTINNPLYVGTTPTGIYTSYGKWDICWTTDGTNSTGYYGRALLANEGTGVNWTHDTTADYVNYSQGSPSVVMDFQCNGTTIYLYPSDLSGYWTSFATSAGTYTNVEYDQNTSSTYSDSFLEYGTSPRFC